VNAFWSYFWPPFCAGLIVGIVAGAVAFRTWRKRNPALGIGVGLTIILTLLWHGPLGAADRFVAQVERTARQAIVFNEVPWITARIHHDPLTRRVILSGRADDFQRSELVRIIGELPGVSSAQWTAEPGGPPLIVEGPAVAILGFLLGLLVAYLRELRRRYNAEWNW
jgi:hypothetical protein